MFQVQFPAVLPLGDLSESMGAANAKTFPADGWLPPAEWVPQPMSTVLKAMVIDY